MSNEIQRQIRSAARDCLAGFGPNTAGKRRMGALGFLLDFTEYAWFFDDRRLAFGIFPAICGASIRPVLSAVKKILEYAELSAQELADPESYWYIAGDSYSYAMP